MQQTSEWILVKGYSHYCNNKSLFENLTEYRNMMIVDGHEVYGIGDVKLPIRTSEHSREPKILHLKNVLYIPSALCNGFEYTFMTARTTIINGIIYCYSCKDELLCVGLPSISQYHRLVLFEMPKKPSLLFSNRNQFFDIYLKKKDIKNLYGENQSYPLYLL